MVFVKTERGNTPERGRSARFEDQPVRSTLHWRLSGGEPPRTEAESVAGARETLVDNEAIAIRPPEIATEHEEIATATPEIAIEHEEIAIATPEIPAKRPATRKPRPAHQKHQFFVRASADLPHRVEWRLDMAIREPASGSSPSAVLR